MGDSGSYSTHPSLEPSPWVGGHLTSRQVSGWQPCVSFGWSHVHGPWPRPVSQCLDSLGGSLGLSPVLTSPVARGICMASVSLFSLQSCEA